MCVCVFVDAVAHVYAGASGGAVVTMSVPADQIGYVCARAQQNVYTCISHVMCFHSYKFVNQYYHKLNTDPSKVHMMSHVHTRSCTAMFTVYIRVFVQ